MITPHLEAVALAGSLLLDDGTPPQAPDLRLRELMQAYAQGYHGMLLSAPEMHWLYFSGVVFGLFFLGVAIWSHRGKNTAGQEAATLSLLYQTAAETAQAQEEMSLHCKCKHVAIINKAA